MTKHIKLFEDFVSEKVNQTEQWWKKYTKYQLSVYPVNIPEDDVTVDLSGDIDSHPVMTWNSPTTGKKVYSYTKARMDAQKSDKYDRISKMSDEQIERIKVKCHEDILTGADDVAQAAAVLCIIAQTGLRPGSVEGFDKTENRGVLTLGPDNVTVNGSQVQLEFVGKSYKDNIANIDDGVLANYLDNKIKSRHGENFLFNVSKGAVDAYYKRTLNMDGFKIKDLRTFVANKIAKWFLNSSNEMPPPVPDKPAEIKKAVKNKLKHTFEYVSNKLNNSPAMAKNSYVNPAVIDEWLDKLGIRPAVIAEDSDKPEVHAPVKFLGNAPVYNLPEWWDDDIELVKDK